MMVMRNIDAAAGDVVRRSVWPTLPTSHCHAAIAKELTRCAYSPKEISSAD